MFFSISHFLLSNYYRAGRCSAFFSSLKLLHFPLINGRAPSKVHYFLFFFLFYFKLPPFSFLSKTKLAIFFFFKRNYLAKLHSLLIKRNYLAKLHSLLINAYHSCCQGWEPARQRQRQSYSHKLINDDNNGNDSYNDILYYPSYPEWLMFAEKCPRHIILCLRHRIICQRHRILCLCHRILCLRHRMRSFQCWHLSPPTHVFLATCLRLWHFYT